MAGKGISRRLSRSSACIDGVPRRDGTPAMEGSATCRGACPIEPPHGSARCRSRRRRRDADELSKQHRSARERCHLGDRPHAIADGEIIGPELDPVREPDRHRLRPKPRGFTRANAPRCYDRLHEFERDPVAARQTPPQQARWMRKRHAGMNRDGPGPRDLRVGRLAGGCRWQSAPARRRGAATSPQGDGAAGSAGTAPGSDRLARGDRAGRLERQPVCGGQGHQHGGVDDPPGPGRRAGIAALLDDHRQEGLPPHCPGARDLDGTGISGTFCASAACPPLALGPRARAARRCRSNLVVAGGRYRSRGEPRARRPGRTETADPLPGTGVPGPALARRPLAGVCVVARAGRRPALPEGCHQPVSTDAADQRRHRRGARLGLVA